MSKCQRSEQFTGKLRALLYYVHITTYNWINCKYPRILIVNFYRLVWFYTRRCFCASLSVKVLNLGHPVSYVRKYCTKKTGHKIYLWIPARSTRHYTLLHNTTILHTKIFFAPFCHQRRNFFRDKTVTFFTDTPMLASHVIVHFKIRFRHKFGSKNPPFYFFWVRVRVGVRVKSTTIPQEVYIATRDYMRCLLFLFLRYLQLLSH